MSWNQRISGLGWAVIALMAVVVQTVAVPFLATAQPRLGNAISLKAFMPEQRPG